jgi:predicted nucleic acid-binding protein
MKYLLDNDSISFLFDDQRGIPHQRIHKKIASLKDEDQLQTSVLILYELEYSFYNASKEKREPIRKTIISVLENFDKIIPVTEQSASIFGELKAFLKRHKNLDRKEIKKHNIDIALASAALIENAVIISSDNIYKELALLKVELKSENWLN